jgi:hypothetical protein
MRDQGAQIAVVLAPVLGDQAGNAEPAAPIAAATRHLQHVVPLSAMSPSVIMVFTPPLRPGETRQRA